MAMVFADTVVRGSSSSVSIRLFALPCLGSVLSDWARCRSLPSASQDAENDVWFNLMSLAFPVRAHLNWLNKAAIKTDVLLAHRRSDPLEASGPDWRDGALDVYHLRVDQDVAGEFRQP
jgi:hypothetical protein